MSDDLLVPLADHRDAHTASPLSPEHKWSGPSDLATCVVCSLPRRPTRRASDVGGSRCPECYRHLGTSGMRPHLRPDDFESCPAGIDAVFPASRREAPINVERLAEAMKAARAGQTWTPTAVDIAAEYDRLSRKSQP